MPRCRSGISKETRPTVERRVGAALAARVYILPLFAKQQSWKRWNVAGVPGLAAAAGMPARRSTLRGHPPSGSCRRSTSLMAHFSRYYYFLLSFLSSCCIIFSSYFPTAPCLYQNCQPSCNGHFYRQNMLSKQPHICILSCFHVVTNPPLISQRSLFLLFSSLRYSFELISPLILQMRYSRNNRTNISSVNLNLGYINLGYRGESDPENLDFLFYGGANKVEG